MADAPGQVENLIHAAADVINHPVAAEVGGVHRHPVANIVNVMRISAVTGQHRR